MLRFLPYVLGLASISAVVWFIYDSGFDKGVEKTKIQYEEVIKKERKRVETANKEALDKARQNIENLEARLEVRNAQIRQIVSEAAQDPAATNDAISSSSVSRINRILRAADSNPGPR